MFGLAVCNARGVCQCMYYQIKLVYYNYSKYILPVDLSEIDIFLHIKFYLKA